MELKIWGADQLKVLQQIADSVVDEQSRTPAYKATDKTQLFHHVDAQVFKARADGDLLSTDEIKRTVFSR